MEESSLAPHEWFAVTLFVLITTSLSGLAYFTQTHDLPTALGEPFYVAPQQIAIRLSGAVQEQGTVWVAKGSKISDLIGQIALTDDADLSRLDLDKPLRRGQALKVPVKKKPKKKATSPSISRPRP